MKLLFAILLFGLALAGCSDVNVIPKEDPNERLQSILFGYRVKGHTNNGPVAIGYANQAYWVRSLVTEYKEASFDETSLEENTIEHVDECLFNFPTKTQNTQAVFAKQSYEKANLFVLSRIDVARRVKQVMDEFNKSGKTLKMKGHHYDSFKVATVYVADSVEDTTLVLISDTDNYVWNIQAKDGAQIKNIAIIARSTPAIVNAPAGANILALSKKYSPHCFVEPARPPQDYWFTVQNNEKRNFRYSEELEDIQDAHGEFDNWFYTNFDQSSEDYMVGSAEGSHFFVGQQPTSAERIEYTPIHNQPILFGKTDYDVIKGETNYLNLLQLQVATEAELMLGLKLGTLN